MREGKLVFWLLFAPFAAWIALLIVIPHIDMLILSLREKVAPLMPVPAGLPMRASVGPVTPAKAVLAMRDWAVQLTKGTVAPGMMVSAVCED